MATVSRQPFAPLDGARLQSLTSLKNRQNALSPSTSAKRKASDSVEIDDFENVDPVLFSKRSKSTASASFFPSKDFVKPAPSSSFVLTKATSAPDVLAVPNPIKAATTAPRPRAFLQPKSPAARLTTATAPLSAPAGRSPTRGSKRVGILSRRRTGPGVPFGFGSGSAAPPAFGAAPFSLDAALRGSIPSYTARAAAHQLPAPGCGLDFAIHEDTPEQEMTNLLQHSTCVLDISSDEEAELKVRRERAEGRDKENIPPADDVSQTRAQGAAGGVDDMVVEKVREPLGKLDAAEFYPAGCDAGSVVVVPGDEVDEEEVVVTGEVNGVVLSVPVLPEFAPELPKLKVDELVAAPTEPAKAAVLQPMEGTGESFDLWESGSAKDEAEPVGPPSPAAVEC